LETVRKLFQFKICSSEYPQNAFDFLVISVKTSLSSIVAFSIFLQNYFTNKYTRTNG
jgi:hypothetical protein